MEESKLKDSDQTWKKHLEKISTKSSNPFENYPIGPFGCGYSYFCPECSKPVCHCTCASEKLKN